MQRDVLHITLIGDKGEEQVEILDGATVRDVATQRYNLFGKNAHIKLNNVEVPWDTKVKDKDVVVVG